MPRLLKNDMHLTTSQTMALDFVRAHATKRAQGAQTLIAHICEMSAITQDQLEAAAEAIKRHARVGIHFHPDRLDGKGQTVVASLLKSGAYRSQFETLISNGKVSPKLGGARDLWENGMFGDAYKGGSVARSERPKYGALNLMLAPDGPSPRFGSCYFLLKPSVLSRCTFTYMDSHLEPINRGTIDTFDDILAPLLKESFERSFSLGMPGMRPPALIEHLTTQLQAPFEDPSGRPAMRNLDFYIEAQVHGDIDLARDVEVLVSDPSFAGTVISDDLNELCEAYRIPHHQHSGFQLSVDQVPADFRGVRMPSLAARISENGIINARLIGDAARALKYHPETWHDRGSDAEVLQELKMLWHVLVQYGKPFQLFNK